MATIAISGITDFTASLRRKVGDQSATVYSNTSLDLYCSDGFQHAETLLELGYVITFTGGIPYVTPEPDNLGKQVALLAAEWIVKNDRAMQLIGNAIAAKDGAQSIDTSKGVNAAVDMAELAEKKLMAFVEEAKFILLTSGATGGVIDTYSDIEVYTSDDGSKL